MSKFSNITKEALNGIDANDLKPAGGGNFDSKPIVKFYQFNALSDKAGQRSAQMVVGTEVVGKFSHSYTKSRDITLKTGKSKTITETKYIINTNEGAVAIPATAQLNALMKDRKAGEDIKIVYKGMEVIKSGPRAGNEAHGFYVTPRPQN